MRKALSLLPIALFAAGGLATAQDESPWYVALGGGLQTIPETQGFDPSDGYALDVAFGYRFGESQDGALRIALEAEYYYAENDLDDFPVAFGLEGSDLSTGVFFGNVVADWYWTDTTALYFGGGAGLATVEVFDIEDDVVAYQGKVGLRFQLGGGFGWNLGYRYVRTEEIADADDFENGQHVAEIGVTWQL